MLYLNGDNNLTHEVLYALDMVETVSSSDDINILALVDETDGTYMTLQEFRHAIRRGLNGKKFDAMVFFSCLTSMVEIGYALKDLTEYLIGSEDEIRIVNNPPGSFQI